MKIILLQDEKKLGKKGDIINASDGYARNYILPKGIGVEATAANINDLKLQTLRQLIDIVVVQIEGRLVDLGAFRELPDGDFFEWSDTAQ